MRSRWLLLFLAFAFTFPFGALADDVYKATLSATAGASSAGTQVVAGEVISLVCTGSGTAHYRACTTSSCAATVNDWPVPSGGMDIEMPSSKGYLAVYAETADMACRWFRRNPQPYRPSGD